MKKKICAYCGEYKIDIQREHVIPRCLYPESKDKSKVQRITVPSCAICNNSFSGDEAHFRNAVVLAGEANDPSIELWKDVTRSFDKIDGRKRFNGDKFTGE